MPIISLTGVVVVDAADVTAPILSSPAAAPTGQNTADASVTTDEDNGTLFWLASVNASESVAAVKAGSSQAVSATGVQNVSVVGLSPQTEYYIHFVHSDLSGNDSAVSTSALIKTPTRISLTGVVVAGLAPVITSVSGSFVAGQQITIETDGTYDLTDTQELSANLGGVALTGVTFVDADTAIGTLPVGGLELGVNHNLVLSVDATLSNAYPIAYGPALGAFVTLAVPYAALHPDSPLRNPAYSDLVAGDQVEYDNTSTPGGFAVSMDSSGLVTIANFSGVQVVDFALHDASDSYARSNVSQWTFNESSVDAAPTVTAPANTTLEFPNGGSGLAKDNAALVAWLALATANDPEEGSLTPTADLSGLADPIPAGAHVITFSATDSADNTGTDTATLTVQEAAADPTPPTFTTGLIQQAITSSSATVGFSLSEAGFAYAIAVPQGSAVPTPAQIKAGVDYSSVTVLSAANKSVTTAADSLTLSSIAGYAGQQITVYATAENNGGGLQTQGDIRALTVTLTALPQSDSFWSFTPKQSRILNMDSGPLIDQDKNASLNYWLNFGFVVSPLTISSFSIDPDNELPQDKPTITGVGVNTAELTDSDGNTYPVGTVVGITVSGGALEEVYHTVVRFIMNSGESDDRTLSIRIVDK